MTRKSPKENEMRNRPGITRRASHRSGIEPVGVRIPLEYWTDNRFLPRSRHDGLTRDRRTSRSPREKIEW